MDARSRTCCCLHIKTCASIISLINIILEIGSLGYGYKIILWWVAPMGIAFIIFYILVIVGVCTERPGFLLPAEIFLVIKIVFTCFFSFVLIIYSRYLPQKFVDRYKDYGMFDQYKRFIQHFFFVFAISVLIYSCFTIYSFMVIHKARKWLTANAKTVTHPVTESVSVIVYDHPQHHYYHGSYIDPSMQYHVHYVNPAYHRSSYDSNGAPPSYYASTSMNNYANTTNYNYSNTYQQSAMTQSQLQRYYNGASTTTTTAIEHPQSVNTIRYPSLPSAPPRTP